MSQWEPRDGWFIQVERPEIFLDLFIGLGEAQQLHRKLLIFPTSWRTRLSTRHSIFSRILLWKSCSLPVYLFLLPNPSTKSVFLPRSARNSATECLVERRTRQGGLIVLEGMRSGLYARLLGVASNTGTLRKDPKRKSI